MYENKKPGQNEVDVRFDLEKTYKDSESGITVTFHLTVDECGNQDKFEQILSRYATLSHRFYLDVGDDFNSKRSREDVKHYAKRLETVSGKKPGTPGGSQGADECQNP